MPESGDAHMAIVFMKIKAVKVHIDGPTKNQTDYGRAGLLYYLKKAKALVLLRRRL
jgi:hypothetical protein